LNQDYDSESNKNNLEFKSEDKIKDLTSIQNKIDPDLLSRPNLIKTKIKEEFSNLMGFSFPDNTQNVKNPKKVRKDKSKEKVNKNSDITNYTLENESLNHTKITESNYKNQTVIIRNQPDIDESKINRN